MHGWPLVGSQSPAGTGPAIDGTAAASGARPQVVQPDSNPAAWTIFLRDITRICQYFASQGLRRDPRKLAAELWTSHGHRLVQEVHPRDLDPEKMEDRRLWEKQKTVR